ncbi:GNAT family N-acetyltransferase [Antrihabitans sp. YC2-6]|uniref:GNAT family N-acetyltransferase n=1 Tax=Antrihabitans sp. YC2-6 TaxID=2799498 RepID=UPI0018F40230|nr:GNAT family N-acetyltransferase [Antrihabitans sp. YC2-6]MBJ8346470.1 N-acetyltransferase [Antrihabitans sp. YC2-6]
MDTRVEQNTDHKRFEIYVGTQLAGLAAYENADANRAFVHTEVYPQFEGQGLAKILIKDALDKTRADGLGVLPFCPFVHRYVSKNPEYLELVPKWARERLGLPAA